MRPEYRVYRWDIRNVWSDGALASGQDDSSALHRVREQAGMGRIVQGQRFVQAENIVAGIDDASGRVDRRNGHALSPPCIIRR